MTEIVGRPQELARVGAFVTDGAGDGCLVIQGEAGVGKTTLWRSGIDAARERGFTVLLSRPLELDMRIPFAGLRDLLSSVLGEVSEALPEPQRRALDAALLRADPAGLPLESGAIAFALLGGLEALARRASVVVGIDDVQWLDEPSAVALRFALHRVGSADVRVLVAERTHRAAAAGARLERVFELERLESIALGGMSVGSIQHILKAQLGVALPRPLLLKVYAGSGGNPFFALELARALQRHGQAEPGRPLPVPETLSALVEQRVAELPRQTQRGLEIAALLSEPTTALVAAAADGEIGLRAAIAAEVVTVDNGRIHFMHPLLSSTVTMRIGEERRSALHQRLAELVTDPEERARHIALGASGEAPEAASVLEQAARLASARGAPMVAAELLEHALLHTPQGAIDDRVRRLLATAKANHLAGDPERALVLALDVLDRAPGGRDRLRALVLVGEIDGRIAELEQGVAEADDDPLMRARLQIQLAENCFAHDLRESLRHARDAVSDARAGGDDALLAQALAMQSWFEGATTSGEPDATAALAARLERDVALEVKGDFTSEFTHATLAMWRDEHDVARQGFQSMRRSAAELGRVFDQAHALLNLAQVEWRAGNWDRAADHIDEAVSLWPRGDSSARSLALWISAVLASHRGQLDTARADAEEGLAAAGEHVIYRGRNLWVIGFTALSAGQLDEALAHLAKAAALFDAAGAAEPGMRLFTADLLDAYIAAGSLDHAQLLADELVRRGQQLGRPRATIIGTRGTGLVLTARGEHKLALDALDAAATAARHWSVPLEQGRTLLALGTAQRRARRRRDARTTLTDALRLFEQISAPAFTARAQAELQRIGGRTPAGQNLTPAEQNIAELAARGLTNREVAAQLVITTHTVETALTRIYSKLGLRSRTELAHRQAAAPDDADP